MANEENTHIPSPSEEDDNAGLPSVFSNWKQVYWLLLIELFVLIGLFYWFTIAFA